MPRTENTYDAFTAIAEPKRRYLIEQLIGNELSVSQLVELTQWKQPAVSKHLRVLKDSGLVAERKAGRQRIYRVNAQALLPIQTWVRQFEKHWQSQFEQLDQYLLDLQKKGEDK